MNAFILAALLFLFLPEFPRAETATPPCPDDITFDDSSWVLRQVSVSSDNASDYAHRAWKRVFAYQPDYAKRFRKEFHPACFAEVHSFVVERHQRWVAKRVVSERGTRAFLLLSNNTWVEGTGITVYKFIGDPSRPAFFAVLEKDGKPVAERRIDLPPLFLPQPFQGAR